ncbi:MAG: SprT family zinc-dependent metalloprotease [Thermaerobacter sp.]|nr:SprT family zinc-dependent metalloprotease [Thermaerobacter sp.]
MRTDTSYRYQVTLNGLPVSYRVEVRPRRQHAAIQITAQRDVVVLLPPQVSPEQAEALLRQKAAWVTRHLTAPSRPVGPAPLADGSPIWLLGVPLVLRFEAGGAWHLAPDPDHGLVRLIVPDAAPPGDAARVARSLVQEWLVARAAASFTDEVARWQPRVGGPVVTALRVRDYKTRWGVARSDGTLTFNWRLIQAPAHCLTYVVVHELTHLRHPHHQDAFWRAVARVLPAYPESKQWLSAHGQELYH